ncbi:hypothetical protein [Ichthyenterobacterium magnum]|uniref:Cytochrome c domain-containing protein n=1 Tax=Ichthyenterobacterium magnum TaxID=1230530 RepID=A0A420DLB9_9FLAO|nr:hypothetical protein [Ichthyenterobacterium magnum]RKE94998.1 hypothetical protein BXY80_2016 [Ichthyenterobacterium magnum]
MKNSIATLLISSLILFNCTNASENDLIETIPLPTVVTYTSNIKTIIDNNCIECHNNPPINDAPMPLLTYENVKDAIENRGLINRISSDDLAFSMPFGGPKLPQNLIDLVIQWEADGLIE